MPNFEDAVTKAKDNIPNITPTPPSFHSQATAYELKSRLQWGEPGLTIVDVRDHDAFNQERILGAISMPMANLREMAGTSLMQKRDIYVYGANDEETASAANTLRQAGFAKVAELKGGMDAWREISAPMEGIASDRSPSQGAYNLGARLREFAQVKAKERAMR